MCRTDRLCSQAGVRSEGVSLIRNQELAIGGIRCVLPAFRISWREIAISWRESTQSREENRTEQKSREQNRTVQYSTVEQTRAEKKRADITAEQNKIENGE
mgnify:CR=1 FL=1